MCGKEETNSMSGKEETNSMSGKEYTNHEIKPVEIKFKKRDEMYKGHGVMRKIKS